MSKTVGVRSHPQHRWAHHVHDILKETTKNNLRNVLQDGKSPNIKGKKANKISPAAPILSPFESKHTKVTPVFNNANRRKVTTVVPTRIGNVVRINVAENDGHQLPASWCFSHKKLHQHSKLRRIMSWWYSIQFLLQICLVIVTASMPYLAVPKDTEQFTSQLQNRRFLSTKTNETESTRSFRADQYYLSAREAFGKCYVPNASNCKRLTLCVCYFVNSIPEPTETKRCTILYKELPCSVRSWVCFANISFHLRFLSSKKCSTATLHCNSLRKHDYNTNVCS